MDNLAHLDVDSEEFDEAPKALRDYVKKLQKQNKELGTELDGVRATAASNAVTSVLADKGFKNPERVKAAILADQINPLDSSAVEKWLADNGDDYAKVTPDPATPPADETPAPEAQAMQQVNSLNVQQGAGVDALQKAMAEITEEMTPEQVRAVFIKHGA